MAVGGITCARAIPPNTFNTRTIRYAPYSDSCHTGSYFHPLQALIIRCNCIALIGDRVFLVLSNDPRCGVSSCSCGYCSLCGVESNYVEFTDQIICTLSIEYSWQISCIVSL